MNKKLTIVLVVIVVLVALVVLVLNMPVPQARADAIFQQCLSTQRMMEKAIAQNDTQMIDILSGVWNNCADIFGQ